MRANQSQTSGKTSQNNHQTRSQGLPWLREVGENHPCAIAMSRNAGHDATDSETCRQVA